MTNPDAQTMLDELQLLINEYDPANSDWAFRKGVISELVARTRAAASAHVQGERRWRHKKRGTTYIEVGRGKLQSFDPGGLSDLDPMVIYRSEVDGSMWVRPADEFEDGRFEELPSSDRPVSASVAVREDTAAIVAIARSRIAAMKIAPCSGIVSSKKAAEEIEAALDALSQPAIGTRNDVREALTDIAAERQRQIGGEGWTPEHDDAHTDGSMATAAAVYALHPFQWHLVISERFNGRNKDRLLALSDFWPWDLKWWKPKDRRCNLVRAGALIVAEIERLDRALAASPQEQEGK